MTDAPNMSTTPLRERIADWLEHGIDRGGSALQAADALLALLTPSDTAGLIEKLHAHASKVLDGDTAYYLNYAADALRAERAAREAAEAELDRLARELEATKSVCADWRKDAEIAEAERDALREEKAERQARIDDLRKYMPQAREYQDRHGCSISEAMSVVRAAALTARQKDEG